MFHKAHSTNLVVVHPQYLLVLLSKLKLGPFQSPPTFTVLLPVQYLLLFSLCLDCAVRWEVPVGELSTNPPPLLRTPRLIPRTSALTAILLPGVVVDGVEGSIIQ